MTPQQLPVFFIVGRERSGTTLLQVLLDNHPQVVIPTESPFIKHLYRKHSAREKWNKDNILEFCNDLWEEPYLGLWSIDKEKLKNDLLSQAGSTSFASLCKTVYLHSLSAEDKNDVKLVGDKNPQYSLFIPQLLNVFPGAKFIFITRDPRDQALSMLKVNFERKIIASLVYRWKHFNRKIEEQRKKYPSQFYTLKYEDLIAQPETQLKAITQFLGIAYDDVMLRSDERAAFYVSSHSLVKEHHQSLLKPIDAGMAYQWKLKMKERDVRTADAVAGRFAEEIGYERRYKSPSPGTVLRAMPGVIYGKAYFTFLTLLDSIPYSWRMFLFRNFIAKRFGFWRDNAGEK